MPRAVALLALATILPALAGASVGDSRRLPAPAAAGGLTPGHMCGTQGTYAPGGAYQVNLQLLAALTAAEVNANSCNCSAGSVAGERPDQAVASAFCYWRPGASTSDCGACVELALREAQRLCPYHRQAQVVAADANGGVCSISFHDVDRMEQEMGVAPATGMALLLGNVLRSPDVLAIPLFQAAGLGCVVFLFIQEWRARSRGPASNGYLTVSGDLEISS